MTLNPETTNKLRQFGNRQRRLLLLRSLCVAVVSFLLVMSLVALVDWLWILPMRVRWGLSLGGYALVLLIVWQHSLRKWTAPQLAETLAREFESAHPDLRENLLSAVELSKDEAQGNGSPLFRQLLQNNVAENIAWIDVRKLLPVRMVGRWLVGAIAVTCLFGIMLSLPGFSFRQLITRAMLPGANVDRVSQTRVAILEPNPPSRLVPRGETVGIVAQLSGPEVEHATLEAYGDSQGMNRQEMRGQGERRFAANITVRDERVDYRILAGDAVTRHYRLESRPRPRVTAFGKTFRFPEYTGLDDEILTETSGDLIALEGTTVDLALHVDQQVSEAQILIENPGTERIQVIDASRNSDGLYSATIPLRNSGVYKVHLKSAETGFENTFSSKFEIRPEPDLIPRVGFVDIDSTTLLRPANDIIALTALAEDDLPLVELRQVISINGGAWKRSQLEMQPSRRVTARWELDLLDLSLTSGDVVTVKLEAKDRKQQVGESIPLQIVITEDDFDPHRHDALTVRAYVADQLAEFAKQMQELTSSTMEVFSQREETLELNDEDRKLLRDAAATLEEQVQKRVEVIQALLEKVPAGLDAFEVELVLAQLSQMGRHHGRYMRHVVEQYTTEPEKDRKHEQLFKQVRREFMIVGDNAKWLDERFRDMVSYDFLGGIAIDLYGLLNQQAEITEVDQPYSEARLRRHQEVAINYVHALEDLIEEHADRIRNASQSHLDQLRDMIASVRQELQLALDNVDDDEPLKRVTDRISRELGGRLNASIADGNLVSQIANSRRDLARRAGVLTDSLDLAIRSAQQVTEKRQGTLDAKDSDQTEEAKQELELAQRELQWRLSAALEQLADRTDAQQKRQDRKALMLSDLRLASRAATHVFQFDDDLESDQETLANMRTVRDALRVLEAGHSVFEYEPVAAALLSSERWESQEFTTRIANPRLWDAIRVGLEVASERASSARYPREIIDQINNIRWKDFHRANEKISMRRWRREAVSAASGIEQLVGTFAETRLEINPVMEEARRTLRDLLPKISETASQLAEQARDLQEKTEEAAKDSDDPADEQQAQELQQQQQSLSEQIEALLAALAEDADRQDLMTEQGRERARDADDSIELIREPEEAAATELQDAVAAEPADRQEALQQAAAEQKDLADALQQVAEHFDKLERGEDVAESRNQLRDAEQEMERGREIAQQYQRSEQLAELDQQANNEQQQLMQELERELQENPEMQEALSDIAAEAVAQAVQALDFAKQKEEQAQSSLEKSDTSLQSEKRNLAQELRALGTEASLVARNLAAQADNASQRAGDPKTAEKARQAQRQLEQAANKARGVSENNTLQDIREAASEITEQLQQASQDLADVQKAAEEQSKKLPDGGEKAKEQLKRDWENIANRTKAAVVRDFASLQRTAEAFQRQAQQRATNAQRQENNEEKRLKNAETQLNRQPDNQGLKNQVADAKKRLEAAQRQTEQEQQLAKQAEEQTNAAKQNHAEARDQKLNPLDAENPAAQYAARSAEQAQALAEKMAEKSAEMAGPIERMKQELAASESQLEAVRQTQEHVGDDVKTASDDLRRAARHEERLGSPTSKSQLEQSADDVAQVADQEVAAAEEKAGQAREKSKQGQDVPQEGGQSPSAQTAQAVGEAQEAISQQADNLANMLAQSQAAQQANQNSDRQQATSDSESSEPQSASSPSQQGAAAQAAQTAQNPDSNQASEGQELANSQNSASGQPSDTAASQQGTPSASGESTQSSPASSATAAQPGESSSEHAERLARMLDDLDRAMHAEPVDGGQNPASSPAMPSLAQMAAEQAAQMSQQRNQSLQETPPGMPSPDSLLSGEGAELEGMAEEDLLASDVKRSGEEWGKLREQNAEDTTSGKRGQFAHQYRDQIKAYFKVIAERSRK